MPASRSTPPHALSRVLASRVTCLALSMAAWLTSMTGTASAQAPAAPPDMMAQDSAALLTQLYAKLQAARQQLQDADTGANTRTAQRGAVSLFDQLIAAAERDEAERGNGSSAAQSGGAPRPQATPDSPEPKPDDDKTTSESRPRRPDSGQPAAWGRLRERQRDEILNSVPGRPLPPRYRALVDQYFESFQNERR